MYLALKYLHVTTVVLSFGLFVLRGVWMLADSPRRQRRWVGVVRASCRGGEGAQGGAGR